MQLKKAPIKTKKYWIIQNVITCAIITIVFLSILIALNLIDKSFPTIVYMVGTGILLFLWVYLTFISPRLRYNYFSYGISEDKIEFHSGIFVKKETIIPMVRIQHITVSEGPLSKRFWLGDLEITTANGSITLNGIPIEEARVMAQTLNTIVGVKVGEEREQQ